MYTLNFHVRKGKKRKKKVKIEEKEEQFKREISDSDENDMGAAILKYEEREPSVENVVEVRNRKRI